MFTSHMRIGAFLDSLITDMGLYNDRDRGFYRDRMNETLTFLYTAVIRERAEGKATPLGGLIACADIPTPDGTAAVQPSDILAVYCGSHQLRYLPPENLHAADGMSCCFYTVTEDGILLSHANTVQPLRVIFTIRPPQYGADGEDACLPMPEEFVPLVAAKIRGDVYRAANEDELSAKWLAVYNSLLSDFYDYLAARRRR
ncbi:MAG: hypothetical protein IJY20_01725 [Clostridia bacterium]|nr:hypothetical protein [Clostridia bacterium]